jgi:UDP-N-acetylmuramate--alanine ligase
MLAELMRLRIGIAIAGAHGKTTTTSMVALVLERAGLDPTAVIGGRLSAFGSNARLGQGPYMVVEADESDRSFLKLSPAIAVVTNLDHEHLDTYGSFERIVDAFRDFGNSVPFYGALVACLDDSAVRDMLPALTRRTITYGFTEGADVQGIDAVCEGQSAACRVRFSVRGVPAGVGEGQLTLRVPGRHNLQNALAATAVGLELGVSFDQIGAALAEFRGVERRYEHHGDIRGVRLVDDYAHHPTEIAAVLQAARDGRPKRLVVAFQPHRFSRTRALLYAFGPSLALADVVLLTDIYAAGEVRPADLTIDTLADAVRLTVPDVRIVRQIEDLPAEIAGLARPGDLVLTLGAGSIGGLPPQILSALRAGETVQ